MKLIYTQIGYFVVFISVAVKYALSSEGVQVEDDLESQDLLSDVKMLEKGLLRTELKTNEAINDVKDGLPELSNVVGRNLRLAKILAFDINNKINRTVEHVNLIKNDVNKTAKGKLDSVKKAASIVDKLENEVGAAEIKNDSKVLHERLKHNPSFSNNSLYRNILKENDVIIRLEGAKIIAVNKAQQKYDKVKRAGKQVAEEVERVQDEVNSAEKEIESDSEVELEDEKIAREKIAEAAEVNIKAIRSTAKSLNRIRKLLKKLETDEVALKKMQT